MLFLFLLLTISAANTRLNSPPQTHPNCELRVTPLPSLQDIATGRPAVQAFAHYQGSPHAVLCLQVPANRLAQPTGVLLVQRSPTHFTRYTYHAQRVDSSHVVSTSWPPLLAKLGKGNYQTTCEDIVLNSTHWLLFAKQGAKLTYSVQFADYDAQDFTATDRAQLAPALALMRRLMK